MSLIKEYFELTKKYQATYGENTLLLMQVGSFFEVYGISNKSSLIITGSKIQDFSRICELNIVEKNTCVGEDNIMMAGFKDFQIDKYIRKLQEADYTVVVYTQDEAAKNTTRSLSGIFSPGTYFANESQKLSNSTACIWIELATNSLLKNQIKKIRVTNASSQILNSQEKTLIIGCAVIDIISGKTIMSEYKINYQPNNPTIYDELERFCSIYRPSEVIFISNLHSNDEVESIINYCGLKHECLLHNLSSINQHLCHYNLIKNCEKQNYQYEVLSKFYGYIKPNSNNSQSNIVNLDLFLMNCNNNVIATQALCYLLDFMYQHNKYLVHKISEPIFENHNSRLLLANHSLKQLNIINDGSIKSSKTSCVLQMLNNCLTTVGKRKFNEQLLHPTFDIEFLENEYTIIQHFVDNYSNYSPFFASKLETIKDLSKLDRQIALKKIAPKLFYQLVNNLISIRELIDFISNDNIILNYLAKQNPPIKNIENFKNNVSLMIEFIERYLILEEAKNIDVLQNFEINFINKTINEKLDNETNSYNENIQLLEVIRSYLSSLIESNEKKSKSSSKVSSKSTSKSTSKVTTDYVKIYETEKNNLSLLCTSRRCKLLETILINNKEHNIILSYNSNNEEKTFEFNIEKSQFKFITQSGTNNAIIHNQINEIIKAISSKKIIIKDLINLVYWNFVEQFSEFQAQLFDCINFISSLDCIYTKANNAKKYNYCKPIINNNTPKSFVNAVQLRHCLIEQLQLNVNYITNNITLGDGETDGILLYGTNAVGKTSVIRALGIALILAQSGNYVPCSSFSFKPYKHLFTRIIGNDNLFKGLSTFAVEMNELNVILRNCDENSLILGDELCSGTETMSAISIFVSGLQKLSEVNSSYIFATHLHEIVNFDEIKEINTLKLKHMEVYYDRENDTLVYDRKLKDGPGNNLYGLEVCKSLNLPLDFITNAYNLRDKYYPEVRSIFSLKTSSYNSQKIIGLCENCGEKMASEVHHLQHQKDANSDGFITSETTVIHKNHLSNLMNLCEVCHLKLHKEQSNGSLKLKTIKPSKSSRIIKEK